jgi:hypothetical protein
MSFKENYCITKHTDILQIRLSKEAHTNDIVYLPIIILIFYVFLKNF